MAGKPPPGYEDATEAEESTVRAALRNGLNVPSGFASDGINIWKATSETRKANDAAVAAEYAASDKLDEEDAELRDAVAASNLIATAPRQRPGSNKPAGS